MSRNARNNREGGSGANITLVDKRKQGRAEEDKTEVAREISGNRDLTEKKENRVQGRGKSQRKTGSKERG